MKAVELNLSDLKKLKEENLIMMLPPGRMGGEDTIIVYKTKKKYCYYYINGRDYYDEINLVFPKRKEAFDSPKHRKYVYYVHESYSALDMGMGCYIYIKREYVESFIINLKKLLEEYFKRELTVEDVLNSHHYILLYWQEAIEKTLNEYNKIVKK